MSSAQNTVPSNQSCPASLPHQEIEALLGVSGCAVGIMGCCVARVGFACYGQACRPPTDRDRGERAVVALAEAHVPARTGSLAERAEVSENEARQGEGIARPEPRAAGRCASACQHVCWSSAVCAAACGCPRQPEVINKCSR